MDPESIDEYIMRGGYKALEKVLFDMNPEKVISRNESLRRTRQGRSRVPDRLKVGTDEKEPGPKNM